MPPPFLGSKNKRNKKPEELCLPPAFTVVSCLDYSSTLKMEEKCSSETSVDFQRLHGVVSQKIELEFFNMNFVFWEGLI
jgi:hypothetical protein